MPSSLRALSLNLEDIRDLATRRGILGVHLSEFPRGLDTK